jgi:putative Mg2+ transporter-C (MgtC) family protein
MLTHLSSDLLILAEAALALVCGGIIGLERELAGKWAGLRTNMLVCFSAALFVEVSQLVVLTSVPVWESGGVSADALGADPVRIVQAIVVGVSFVGAGAVFRDHDRNIARGITTAATLLVVAPIGIAVAEGHYVLALGASLLVVFVLRVLDWVEDRFIPDKDITED